MQTSPTTHLRLALRVALLAGALVAPLAATDMITDAQSRTHVESSQRYATGAGLVILFGLQRG